MKKMTFFFCPKCGEYCQKNDSAHNKLHCSKCDVHAVRTGLFFMLLGFLPASFIALSVQDIGAGIAAVVFFPFMACANNRWFKQYKAKKDMESDKQKIDKAVE